MIDIAHENLIPVRDVPGNIPPRPSGKRVHISAVYRWIQRGVRGVRLESIRLGGTTYTSIEALQRFGDRLRADTLVPASADLSTPRARQREIERAANAVAEELRIASRTSEK